MSIILVPGARRADFITGLPADLEGVKIQNEVNDHWEEATDEQKKALHRFLRDDYSLAPARSFIYGQGARLGYNKQGVYVHENHCKRYFGMPRENAGLMLINAVPEAVPEFSGPPIGRNLSSDMLTKLAQHMPTISDEVRHKIFEATFKTADMNHNKFLSKVEVASMMRKLLGTLSSSDCEDIMREANLDNGDDGVDYKEFCIWMKNKAPPKIKDGLKQSLGTEPCVVRAAFRVWDKNGNGLIGKGEMYKVMHTLNPKFGKPECESLFNLMDADHGGTIDFDEFVDFLFHRR